MLQSAVVLLRYFLLKSIRIFPTNFKCRMECLWDLGAFHQLIGTGGQLCLLPSVREEEWIQVSISNSKKNQGYSESFFWLEITKLFQLFTMKHYSD